MANTQYLVSDAFQATLVEADGSERTILFRQGGEYLDREVYFAPKANVIPKKLVVSDDNPNVYVYRNGIAEFRLSAPPNKFVNGGYYMHFGTKYPKCIAQMDQVDFTNFVQEVFFKGGD